MTHMLCSLAGGRLVVALEVCLLPFLYPKADSSLGWLQPGCQLEVCSGGHKSDPW